ncbi:hypothetical protein TrLO_g11908 [Triparma laevis f. longispina]|uniref:glycerol kinase n=1 Tax=Triparma laevis f. longispina TaxID=1714387 RepID=A0A9W7AAQ3_9STRA|nr:hypothetical protein TrLO_g11908 [Triparma laevis f. longispina]
MLLVLLLSLLLLRPAESARFVIGVDGGTESIRACVFDALTGEPVGEPHAVPYKTSFPKPGHATQDPVDWYDNLCEAVKHATLSASKSIQTNCTPHIEAISLDTTCCSVCFLDSNFYPLRPCLLWMDSRSSKQCDEILDKARNDPALAVNSGGEGPLSAEWMLPKALWYAQNHPDEWASTCKYVCEYQDYLNYRLTSKFVGSSVNAAVRWHFDGRSCTSPSPAGRPTSLYDKVGMKALLKKLPQTFLPFAAPIGKLMPKAAEDLGLTDSVLVVQGGPDAFVGMVGLGCVKPKQLCLITGSSHLHCAVSSSTSTSKSCWGAYRGAPLPDVCFAEGGQSSTGSILRWAKNLFGGEDSPSVTYKALDKEAESTPPGADGVIALETFQGSRTPETDAKAKGTLIGLTLSHTRGHVWRALLEGVCFGTRNCIEGLAAAGHPASEILIAGGVCRSPFWLQMHSDICGLPIVMCKFSDAPLLGSAILASVGAGVYSDVNEAVEKMVKISHRITPDASKTKKYTEIFDTYKKLGPAVRPLVHDLHRLRGGATIAPSLLSADWANIAGEVEKCENDPNIKYIHCDVFDGVEVPSPNALTFGPSMIGAIRKRTKLLLDVHLVVKDPLAYVGAMGENGCDCLIIQYESFGSRSEFRNCLSLIRSCGMMAGACLAPKTGVGEISEELRDGLVDVVDVLSVEPGFASQEIQLGVLSKVAEIKGLDEGVRVIVDGGINDSTAKEVVNSGADTLVSGSYIFHHPAGVKAAVKSLLC